MSDASRVAAVAERCKRRRPLQRRGHIKAIIAAKAFQSLLTLCQRISAPAPNIVD